MKSLATLTCNCSASQECMVETSLYEADKQAKPCPMVEHAAICLLSILAKAIKEIIKKIC